MERSDIMPRDENVTLLYVSHYSIVVLFDSKLPTSFVPNILLDISDFESDVYGIKSEELK